jgi:hypothetical protein
MDWQPIETAPRDGTTIKVHHENAADMGEKFSPNATWDGNKWAVSCYEFSKCGRFLITAQPTHWRPRLTEGANP